MSNENKSPADPIYEIMIEHGSGGSFSWMEVDKWQYDETPEDSRAIRYRSTPPASIQAGAASDADKRGYAAGWAQCAKWADRVDLISDIDSPAYNRDRDAALQRERQQGAE
jgi:hypothetical protein